jgi:hypothetical protein
LFCHRLPNKVHYPSLTRGLGAHNYGLKALELWAQINLSSFKLISPMYLLVKLMSEQQSFLSYSFGRRLFEKDWHYYSLNVWYNFKWHHQVLHFSLGEKFLFNVSISLFIFHPFRFLISSGSSHGSYMLLRIYLSF